MAKAKKKRAKRGSKARARAAGQNRSALANVKFGGREKVCYGKHVKNAKGGGRSPRVYCANID